MDTRRAVPLLLALTLCAATLVALLLLASHPVVALDTLRYVATTGQDAGACDSRNTPCASLQYAVDQADPGDSIRVAGGRYTGILTRPVPAGYLGAPASGVLTQVVYLTKTVHIEGGFAAPLFALPPNPAANPTILDAESQGRVILVSEPATPTLRSLTITGGDGAGLGGNNFGQHWGGGVFVDRSGATMTGTLVISNTAERGGGIATLSGDLGLFDCKVLSNTGTTGTGGVHAHNAGLTTIWGNTIMHNQGVSGAGLSLLYRGGDVRDNVISSNTGTGKGGGVRLFNSTSTLFDSNIIAGNSAVDGGGIYVEYYSRVALSNNVIVNNQASDAGSGIHVERSNVRLRHSTIADHMKGDGAGLYVVNLGSDYSTVWLTNTILVSNTVGIHAETGNTATLEATLWDSNGTDTGGGGSITLVAPNVYEPPGFVHRTGPDFHLSRGSAAVDAGADAGITWDVDGQWRPMRDGFDIGADEAGWAIFLPVVLRESP